MSRERLEYPVSCPNCNKKGTISISSNDYPFMKKEDRRIDRIEGGFTKIKVDDNEILLKCDSCGNEFKAR